MIWLLYNYDVRGSLEQVVLLVADYPANGGRDYKLFKNL